MSRGVLRVSAIALGAAAFVLSSPVPAANAATVAHHYGHAAHARVSHGFHGYVARGHAGHRYVARGHVRHRHYVWRNGHRYAYYGYNPGAGVAAGVIGGAAAGYPYYSNCGDYYYGSYYGSCDAYSYGYPYPYYDYGYGFGGPVFFGGGRFHHGFHDRGFAFHGGGSHFAGGNFGHMGGFGVGHFGGFGGGHMGGFGGSTSPAAISAIWAASAAAISAAWRRPHGRLRRRPFWRWRLAASP